MSSVRRSSSLAPESQSCCLQEEKETREGHTEIIQQEKWSVVSPRREPLTFFSHQNTELTMAQDLPLERSDSESERSEAEEDNSESSETEDIDDDVAVFQLEGSIDMKEVVEGKTPAIQNSLHQCTFDLRNLVAVNSHQIKGLYSFQNKSNEDITIPNDSVDENVVLSVASASCRHLISELWQLPTERSDAGPLVSLPGYNEIKMPRALVRYSQRIGFLRC